MSDWADGCVNVHLGEWMGSQCAGGWVSMQLGG